MRRQLWLGGILLALTSGLWAQSDDPPARVGRLSYLSGTVSFQPAGTDDWADATLNYPVTTGDRLWADDRSRAEVHVGSAAIRLSMRTAFSFLNLDDNMVQVRLSEGALDITIRDLPQDQAFEVDTPNAAITLLRPGRYRIDADAENMRTLLTVRAGEAEVNAGGVSVPVRAQQALQSTGDNMVSSNLIRPLPPDEFDRWTDERADRESRRPPPRYVSREMVGYEDLDANGDWLDDPQYGHLWAPRVEAGWAPYRFGRWAWVEPWGWTWIDDAPWGFAPFHYGRWANVRGRWCWAPGVIERRPVYAPALVAFVGGNSWSASLSFGGGGGVGWFPLGPREVYRPAYHVSNTYVTRINETHVTNVTNITNVTNVTYVNQRVPGAVTAVSQADFASSRSVARVARPVPTAAVASAGITGSAPRVAPRAPGILAAPAASARPVARPPQTVLNRAVVTKRQPPPAAVPFAARQAALTANPGTPVAPAALSEIRRRQPTSAPLVRPVPNAPGGRQQPQPTQTNTPPRVEQPQRAVQPAKAPPVQTAPAPRAERPAQTPAAQPARTPRAEEPRQRLAQPTQAPPVNPAPTPRAERPAQPPAAQPAPTPRAERPAQPPAAQPARTPRAEEPRQRLAQPTQAPPVKPAPTPRAERPVQPPAAQPAPAPRAEPQRQRAVPPAQAPAAQREVPARNDPRQQRSAQGEQPRQQRGEGRPATTPEQRQKAKKQEEDKK